MSDHSWIPKIPGGECKPPERKTEDKQPERKTVNIIRRSQEFGSSQHPYLGAMKGRGQ